jgi:class 3 adenylate cyclase/tetratricopeptide (TPR) repeat protein
MDTVACPSCGEENPARFRLCGFCGTSLAPVPETIICSGCGEENPSKFRLCGFCGTPLAAGSPAGTPAAAAAAGPAPSAPAPPAAPPGPSLGAIAGGDASPLGSLVAAAPPQPATSAPVLPATEVRKFVTLVFTDLKDSTALTGSIDAEAMNEIKARYFSSMAVEIERHGGKVEKNIGDAIMAVFGLIRAHEDDALRAVRAAFGMQKVLAALNEDLQRFYGVQITNRTGVNTGEIVANTDPDADQNLATGDAVNVTARLEQNAPAGEILIGEVTYELVRNHVEVERLELTLKGKPEPVPAYRLIDVRAEPVARLGSSAAPFVGREAEMDVLRGAFAEVVAKRSARLVTVIGDAGVGKTRLISDFIAKVQAEAAVFRGRCLAYGDGITFWPLVEIVRSAARISEDDSPEKARSRIGALLPQTEPDRDAIVDRVASAVGLSSVPHPVAELFWGARKLLEAQAAARPLVILIDDIHSAESTFLDFLEHLTDSVREAPILVLCSARPELADVHGAWLASAGVERIDLAPLGAADVEAMIDRLLAGVSLATETRDKVVAAAEGNPLYVEQMVSMLRERDPGGDVVVPPTIAALLAARLDGLSRQERAVVDPAAVIGLVFAGDAIAQLVPEMIRASVDDHLAALDRKQFVHPVSADSDDSLFRFHHILVRDAAYQSLLKRARATLHERFVEWAEPVNRERGRETEFEEILGYHLEQAVRYRSELGPLDEKGREIGRRAAQKLSSAGLRALERSDMPAAANLLNRAIALLDVRDPRRLELAPELGEALVVLSRFDEATVILDSALEAAIEIGDPRLEGRIRLRKLTVELFGTESGPAGSASDEARRILEQLKGLGDDGGVARAWRLLALIHGNAGQYDEVALAAQQLIEYGTKADEPRLVRQGATGYAAAAVLGSTPVADALARCLGIADQIRGDRRAEAIVSGALAQLHAMQGNFDLARSMYRTEQQLLTDLGSSRESASTSIESARVELLAGDIGAAEAELSRDFHDLAVMGERYFRSTVAGMLAHTLLLAGRLEEAEDLTTQAEALADPDDAWSQVLWRSTRGCLLASRDGAEAVRLAREATAIAAETADLELHADALADLAEVLAVVEGRKSAEPPLTEALRLYERKGDESSAQRTRRRLEALSASAVSG